MATTIRVSSALVRHQHNSDVSYSHWCPACEETHPFRVEGPNAKWSFNNDLVNPTFQPSMRIFKPAQNGRPEQTLCRYFLTNGIIEYCADRPGEYAGQKVPLPDIPDDWGFGGTRFADLPTE